MRSLQFKLGQRRAVSVAVALAVVMSLSAGPSLAESRASGFSDVTHTPAGRQAAEAATERWAEKYGVYRSIEEVQVLRGTEGARHTTLVLPSDTGVVETSFERRGEGYLSSASYDVSAGNSIPGVAGAGSGWNMIGSNCFAREENSTGWIDSCYKIHQYNTDSTDGSGTRDIFQLHHFATAKSKGIYTLWEARLESDQSTSGPTFTDWHDWDPGADSTLNCTSQNVSVSYGGFGISETHEHCEEWDITKHSDVGHFVNRWDGYVWQSEREVAYMTVIKVNQGASPVWTLWDSFFASA